MGRQRLLVLVVCVALGSAAQTAGAQDVDVDVVRSYVWAGQRSSLERQARLVALFRDESGIAHQCAQLTGDALTEGHHRARVSIAPMPRPPGHMAPARDHAGRVLSACDVRDAHPDDHAAAATWLVGGVFARFGPFVLGAERPDLARVLGVEAGALPERTESHGELRHGVYSLALARGWLLVAAAFLDELPGIEASGTATVPSSATFEQARDALGLHPHRTLGNPAALEPEVPQATALGLGRSRMATGDGVGLLALGDRTLVFAWYPLHESELHRHLRSIVAGLYLAGRLSPSD